MEKIILEIINAYGLELLKALVLAIAGCIGVIGAALFCRYANTETKRAVAKTGVLFVEQVFKDLHGEEKMAKFLDYAAKALKKYGVKFDADEMRALAEAALAVLNNAFNSNILGIEMADGIDVESLDDEQLRALLQQLGFTYTENMSRQEMLDALDEIPTA